MMRSSAAAPRRILLEAGDSVQTPVGVYDLLIIFDNSLALDFYHGGLRRDPAFAFGGAARETQEIHSSAKAASRSSGVPIAR